MAGNTDTPIMKLGSDEFQIGSYIEGLSDFVSECQTPMTVAVQGSWGCGKTSMMNMVRDKLRQDGGILDIWFNTWQFSQFNMDERLAVTFLQHLVKKLKENMEQDSAEKAFALKTVTRTLGRLSRDTAIGLVKTYMGEPIGDVAASYLNKESEVSLAEEVLDLKTSFQQLISATAREKNCRVVIFIDDLDRLQPVRAVELLEILKLFVDCENCVFVLAIDTSVVFQGIREKYGRDISDEKAQSFFDKMIQLPFKMPVAYYKLDHMVISLLDFLKEDMDEEERQECVELIRVAADGNPRSIKRVVNSFLLTDKVASSKGIYKGIPNLQFQSRKILLALSCIQMRYEPVYDFILRDLSETSLRNLLALPVDAGVDPEKLVQGIVKLGGPSGPAGDSVVTYFQLIASFLRFGQRFVDKLMKEEGYRSQTKAYEVLLKILVLGDSVDRTWEAKTAEAAPAAETPAQGKGQETLGSLAQWCELQITLGNRVPVYRKLEELHVYPEVLNSFMVNDQEEMKQYYHADMQVENFWLFKKIRTALEKDFKIEANTSKTDYTFSMYHNRNGGEEIYFHILHPGYGGKMLDVRIDMLMYYQQGTLFLDGLKELVAEVRDQLKLLQDRYGASLFKDRNEFKEITEGGKLKRYAECSFTIHCEEQADALIDFAKCLASNRESLEKIIPGGKQMIEDLLKYAAFKG